MSFLTVSHVSHSFGGRQILEDVSFKLEKENISVWWAPTERENLLSLT